MNRRHFLSQIIKAAAAPMILPGALTYARRWVINPEATPFALCLAGPGGGIFGWTNYELVNGVWTATASGFNWKDMWEKAPFPPNIGETKRPPKVSLERPIFAGGLLAQPLTQETAHVNICS